MTLPCSLRRLSLAIALTAGSLTLHAAPIDLQLPAQPLAEALRQLGEQSGLSIAADSQLTDNLEAPALSGRLDPLQALQQLLQGSGLGYRQSGNLIVIAPLNQTTDTLELAPINVQGSLQQIDRDEVGRNAVYDLDISSVYADKTTIERYKGAAPADVFKGMLNVYSGDARNSGALDPNIRGIQGPGRIPLTIDGTEQAITVWRGYNGANNRNYIDPNLIGSIKAIKGPNLERNVSSGVGGAVVASTIGVGDILQPGQSFGGEFKIEGSNNSVNPRLPTLRTGEDYRTVPGFSEANPIPIAPYNDPTLLISPKTSSDNRLLSSDDYAYRLALGARQDKFEVLAAYAYREKGNHFSGKRKTGFYSQDQSEYAHPADGYSVSMANRWFPGVEVPNTSSQMESWLAKLKLNISDEQSLQFTYRDTRSLYGEIMPSRLEYAASGYMQWPLSATDSQAYSLEYQINPADNRWLDFYVNAWTTRSEGNTYSRGGFPNAALNTDPTLKNTAVANSDNTRYGITLSNKLLLLDDLALTLGGSFQHEKLKSSDSYDPDWLFLALPRLGDRQEHELNFNFEWQPTDYLTLTAGGRYSSYWAFDDQLKKLQSQGRALTVDDYAGLRVHYSTGEVTELSQEHIETSIRNSTIRLERRAAALGWTDEYLAEEIARITEYYRNMTTTITNQVDHTDIWYHDGKGRYSHANNPCTNGSLEGLALVSLSEGADLCRIGGVADNTRVAKDVRAKKQRDYGFVPMLSATLRLTDTARLYFRYSEALRYPSMFESTLGFSSYISPHLDSLKPEHTYNYELAYVHELSTLLGASRYADFKVGYFHHITKDVIERNTNLQFSNIEKQTISGLELQTRYDNGNVFGDFSAAYNLKNEVCDESSAALTDPNGGRVGRCIDDGFPGGYLSTQAIPKISANLLLGTRLLDEKLEVGGRVTYHRKHEYRSFYDLFGVTNSTGFWNMPLQWDDVTLFDAYVSYNLTDNTSVELVGTNLTNIYYIDPISRSAIAAPGRTLRVGFSAQF